MVKDKSPGSDGFTVLFCQESWDILKEDILKVFAIFFERGTINKGVNAAFG